jgi:hypothetical protein
MRRQPPPDPYLEAKLLGIMLAGVFGQTRAECAPDAGVRTDLRPSGVQRICLPVLPRKPKA